MPTKASIQLTEYALIIEQQLGKIQQYESLMVTKDREIANYQEMFRQFHEQNNNLQFEMQEAEQLILKAKQTIDEKDSIIVEQENQIISLQTQIDQIRNVRDTSQKILSNTIITMNNQLQNDIQQLSPSTKEAFLKRVELQENKIEALSLQVADMENVNNALKERIKELQIQDGVSKSQLKFYQDQIQLLQLASEKIYEEKLLQFDAEVTDHLEKKEKRELPHISVTNDSSLDVEQDQDQMRQCYVRLDQQKQSIDQGQQKMLELQGSNIKMTKELEFYKEKFEYQTDEVRKLQLQLAEDSRIIGEQMNRISEQTSAKSMMEGQILYFQQRCDSQIAQTLQSDPLIVDHLKQQIQQLQNVIHQQMESIARTSAESSSRQEEITAQQKQVEKLNQQLVSLQERDAKYKQMAKQCDDQVKSYKRKMKEVTLRAQEYQAEMQEKYLELCQRQRNSVQEQQLITNRLKSQLPQADYTQRQVFTSQDVKQNIDKYQSVLDKKGKEVE